MKALIIISLLYFACTISYAQKVLAETSATGEIAIKGINSALSGGTGVLGESNGIGVKGSSTDGTGVYGSSSGSIGIGVEGSGGTGVVGRGFFGADFWADGPGEDYGSSSSRRWKNNVRNIPDPLQMLDQLRGVYFTWDSEHGGRNSIGFIAEEVGEVLPEIVWYEENGIDAIGMDYSKMTPLILEISKALRHEYQSKIEEQEERIDRLEQKIAYLNNLVLAQTDTPLSSK